MNFSFLKNRVAVVLLVLLVIISLNLVAPEIKMFGITLSLPLQGAFWDAGNAVTGLFGGFGANTVLYQQENKKLKEENLALKQQFLKFEDMRKENDQLREAAGLAESQGIELRGAEIVGRDIFSDIITVRYGNSEGIEEGMPVITKENILVGRVIEVGTGFSKVQLLSHKESSFDGKIETKEIIGVIRGEGSMNLLFDLVSQDLELIVGDLITSSQLGGIFPENLLIGEIDVIQKVETEPFQKASISSYFDIRGAELVFIITSQ